MLNAANCLSITVRLNFTCYQLLPSVCTKASVAFSTYNAKWHKGCEILKSHGGVRESYNLRAVSLFLRNHFVQKLLLYFLMHPFHGGAVGTR